MRKPIIISRIRSVLASVKRGAWPSRPWFFDTRPTRIIQSSFMGSGSTVAVNLIHGILEPDAAVKFDVETHIKSCFITKTHKTNLDELTAANAQYRLFFIVTEREGKKRFAKKYRSYRNVLFIEYDDILETDSHSLEAIALSFATKIKSFLPPQLYPSASEDVIVARTVSRIEKMNAVVAEMADLPFEHFDPFFHIHGSHRDRKAKAKP